MCVAFSFNRKIIRRYVTRYVTSCASARIAVQNAHPVLDDRRVKSDEIFPRYPRNSRNDTGNDFRPFWPAPRSTRGFPAARNINLRELKTADRQASYPSLLSLIGTSIRDINEGLRVTFLKSHRQRRNYTLPKTSGGISSRDMKLSHSAFRQRLASLLSLRRDCETDREIYRGNHLIARLRAVTIASRCTFLNRALGRGASAVGGK